jgi:hypothetical protein
MAIEVFLLFFLVLVYIAISCGHSPGDSGAGRQRDLRVNRKQEEIPDSRPFSTIVDVRNESEGGKNTWRRN